MITKFTPYEVEQCLFDKKRSLAFLDAINNTVKRGDIVVDAGSGSGVLGLFAAKAGAKRVFCVESNSRFREIIEKNARLNGFSGIIEFVCGDAAEIELPCKVDVIIVELLSTGLFFEPEVQVINHLRTFLKEHGKIIPMNCKSWIELIDTQRDTYDLYFDYDSRYEELEHDKPVSNKVIFDQPNFYLNEPLEVDQKVVLKAKKDGLANAVRIISKAQLTEDVFAVKSRFLFCPLVIFLKEPIKAVKNKLYEIHIRYKRGGDTLGAEITVNEPTNRSRAIIVQPTSIKNNLESIPSP